MSTNDPVSKRRHLWTAVPASCLTALLLGGCMNPQAADKATSQTPPATVKNAPKEADLATITLTPQAEERLGIRIAQVSLQKITRMRSFGAEAVLPPDRRTVVNSPMGGTLTEGQKAPAAGTQVRRGQPVYRLLPHVAPERDLRLQMEREVSAAQTRVEAARVRSNRAEQLLKDRAGSEKAAQQAREDLDLATNELNMARSRLDRFLSAPLASDSAIAITAPRDGIIESVHANPGQVVPGGAPLFAVADLSTIWIRVPVYAGELDLLDAGHHAVVRGLSDAGDKQGRRAMPVAAPPTADLNASTVDLYYQLANGTFHGRNFLSPGQRVQASLALRDAAESLVVPWSAILHDTAGGTWVYENLAPQVFTRRRVEVLHVVNSLAVLGRGPAPGAKVVSAGAMELFGTEFGAGK